MKWLCLEDKRASVRRVHIEGEENRQFRLASTSHTKGRTVINRSKLAIAALGLATLLTPASASAQTSEKQAVPHHSPMVTRQYLEAAQKLGIPLEISEHDPNTIVSYQNEEMAAQTCTPASDWTQIGKHLMHYAGEQLPCLTLLKDQIEQSCGCFGDAQQYPQKFDSNDLVVKIMSSKPGYFSLVKPPHLGAKKVFAYYTKGGHFAAVGYPDGSFSYKGSYRIFVVDSNHLVCAYGVWWSSGYVVGARDFTVVPDHLIFQGLRCGEGSVVSYRN